MQVFMIWETLTILQEIVNFTVPSRINETRQLNGPSSMEKPKKQLVKKHTITLPPLKTTVLRRKKCPI